MFRESSRRSRRALVRQLALAGLVSVAAVATTFLAPNGMAATPPAPVAAPAPHPRLAERSWVRRHAAIKAKAVGAVDVLLLGDSITQGWEYSRNWSRAFGGLSTVNAGIASDRVEHIQWRLRDGLLERLRPKVVVLLAGVNNLAVTAPEVIAAGHAAIIADIRARSPETRVLLLGVLPTGRAAADGKRVRVARLNRQLATLADGDRVRYADIGGIFLERDGSLSRRIMFDYLHLTRPGYDRFARALRPHLDASLRAAPAS